MLIQILTLFPKIFESFLNTSLIEKGISSRLFSVELIQIRDFATDAHSQVDDIPYGGGAGMVMKPEPLYQAVQQAKEKAPMAPVILLSPRGAVFNQDKAKYYASLSDIILVCGRYEGVDQRFIDLCVDEEISVGDFILMGGEVGCMAIIEATTRLLEGVVGNSLSILEESFSNQQKVLEYPHYTRPAEFMGQKVPEVLTSGDHKKIEQWRSNEAIKITKLRRPDLIKN